MEGGQRGQRGWGGLEKEGICEGETENMGEGARVFVKDRGGQRLVRQSADRPGAGWGSLSVNISS